MVKRNEQGKRIVSAFWMRQALANGFLPPLLSLFLLAGCVGADVVIREDKNMSPLDGNYLTMAFRTVCEGETRTTFGQAGCSMAWDGDLEKQSVSIVAPLRSSITVKSKTTGYYKTFIVDPAEILTIPLSELVAPQTEFATVSFFSKWEKPDKVKTEVPLRGQEGRFYFRLRPKGSEPAELTWTPNGTATAHAGLGMGFSQFSADGALLREPILLSVKFSQAASDGRYQLFSEAKQIGVKNTPFSGEEILIPRSKIVGPGIVDSYTLAGWAVDKSGLDNDFVAGISLYNPHIQKLGIKIWFTEKELCYSTENVVSLVALSSVEKASNDIEDCFPRPKGEAFLFAFTNVGRAAMAEIDGTKGTYVLHQ